MPAFELWLVAALIAVQVAVPVSPAAQQQSYPPAFPRQNRHVYDQVGTYYQTGSRAITPFDGPRRESTTPAGNISTTRKGTTHVEEGTSDPPLRAVFVELKSETAQDATQLPSRREAAPGRPMSKSASASGISRGRRLGQQRPQYQRDTLLVWLTPGTFRITTDRGGAEVLNVKAGTFGIVREARSRTSS